MKSPELLELTASEPLTFDEEMEMQQKWHLDEDKLTFILLERPGSSPSSSHPVLTPDEIRECRMVGDVNMFLPNGPHEEGECEIMIASPDDRRKGFAREALTLFLGYAIPTLGLRPTNLIARIGRSNSASMALFESLGFGIVKVVEVWDEVEMRWGHTPGSHLGSTDGEAESAEMGSIEGEAENGDGGNEEDEKERRRKDTEWKLRVPEGRTGVYDPPL
ncbi:hypothetical protein EHS25_002126 [Saitozyma podzolica]|uniref:N-acetyltransferase domain-containing protein n=1 Tax=Saitozyma podzolica TaxID=1890683 RepID=A0A427YEH4_9TREE|nr:hypothetical protein EHS25_002126 [Saitozyma podzolica]